MKKSVIISVIVALSLLTVANVKAQTRTMIVEKYVVIEVQSGSHAGEVYEGEVAFEVKVENNYCGSTNFIIMEMNKAELIDAIAGTATLTKANSKKSTSKVARFLKGEAAYQDQYLLTFEDGTSYEVYIEIKELHIKAIVASKKNEVKE